MQKNHTHESTPLALRYTFPAIFSQATFQSLACLGANTLPMICLIVPLLRRRKLMAQIKALMRMENYLVDDKPLMAKYVKESLWVL
jgi:hypothetical protein